MRESFKTQLSDDYMERAIARAAHARLVSPPNPWVGAVLVAEDGTSYEGCTQREGSDHAEVQVLKNAGVKSKGSTLYVTLEPCCHQGKTPPCVDAIIEAEVRKVVVGVEDPDERVSGRGISLLRNQGIEVEVGNSSDLIEDQLRPYLQHRRTGRPFVVLKLAATLDGQIAASDGSSQWITGGAARKDVHQLRAESDAILVGAGTVRQDNPSLTVRDVLCIDGKPPRDPLRVVLGEIPEEARVLPALSLKGSLSEVLDSLGSKGVLQVLVEGGAKVAAAFHAEGLVDAYRLYLAPAFMGGSDGLSLFSGKGATAINELHRCRLKKVMQLGEDIRLDLEPGS